MTLQYLTAGESHGPGLMAILEGMPAGISIDKDLINLDLQRRQKGLGSGARMKIEEDRVQIVSGVMDGKTIGSAIGIRIDNLDHIKWQGKIVQPFSVPRPGHADLTGTIKYGFRDLRPALERASARETAARVAVGAICKQFLSVFGIKIGGYVISLGNIKADVYKIIIEDRFVLAEQNEIRCPDFDAAEKMEALIKKIIKAKNTLGGIIEVIAIGVPPGLGSYSQWDSRMESRLGAAILGIQAIKGVEIGSAFENSSDRGSKVQDPIRLRGTKLVRSTNRAGGIEGGITNGEPIVLRAAMKPIATTLTPQKTVNLFTGEEVPSNYERSDFCPVPRAVPILEAAVAFVLADAFLEKLGGDSLEEIKQRVRFLRKATLSDLRMDNTGKIYWPNQD